MLEKRIPIPVAEAVARVMKYAHQGEIEKVSLIESYGRILGEDVIADVMSLTLIALHTTGLRFEQKIQKKRVVVTPFSLK